MPSSAAGDGGAAHGVCDWRATVSKEARASTASRVFNFLSLKVRKGCDMGKLHEMARQLEQKMFDEASSHTEYESKIQRKLQKVGDSRPPPIAPTSPLFFKENGAAAQGRISAGADHPEHYKEPPPPHAPGPTVAPRGPGLKAAPAQPSQPQPSQPSQPPPSQPPPSQPPPSQPPPSQPQPPGGVAPSAVAAVAPQRSRDPPAASSGACGVPPPPHPHAMSLARWPASPPPHGVAMVAQHRALAAAGMSPTSPTPVPAAPSPHERAPPAMPAMSADQQYWQLAAELRDGQGESQRYLEKFLGALRRREQASGASAGGAPCAKVVRGASQLRGIITEYLTRTRERPTEARSPRGVADLMHLQELHYVVTTQALGRSITPPSSSASARGGGRGRATDGGGASAATGTASPQQPTPPHPQSSLARPGGVGDVSGASSASQTAVERAVQPHLAPLTSQLAATLAGVPRTSVRRQPFATAMVRCGPAEGRGSRGGGMPHRSAPDRVGGGGDGGGGGGGGGGGAIVLCGAIGRAAPRSKSPIAKRSRTEAPAAATALPPPARWWAAQLGQCEGGGGRAAALAREIEPTSVPPSCATRSGPRRNVEGAREAATREAATREAATREAATHEAATRPRRVGEAARAHTPAGVLSDRVRSPAAPPESALRCAVWECLGEEARLELHSLIGACGWEAEATLEGSAGSEGQVPSGLRERHGETDAAAAADADAAAAADAVAAAAVAVHVTLWPPGGRAVGMPALCLSIPPQYPSQPPTWHLGDTCDAAASTAVDGALEALQSAVVFLPQPNLLSLCWQWRYVSTRLYGHHR